MNKIKGIVIGMKKTERKQESSDKRIDKAT